MARMRGNHPLNGLYRIEHRAESLKNRLTS